MPTTELIANIFIPMILGFCFLFVLKNASIFSILRARVDPTKT